MRIDRREASSILPAILLVSKPVETMDPAASELFQSQKDMVEVGGKICQLLGMPRTVGQIFGLLYLSSAPLNLDDMVASLKISKGSASTGTRQLMSYGAIRQVWVPGNRKDYFEIVGDVGNLIRAFIKEFLRPRIENSRKSIDVLQEHLAEDHAAGVFTDEEFEIFQKRVSKLSNLQKKFKRSTPIAERLI